MTPSLFFYSGEVESEHAKEVPVINRTVLAGFYADVPEVEPGVVAGLFYVAVASLGMVVSYPVSWSSGAGLGDEASRLISIPAVIVNFTAH